MGMDGNAIAMKRARRKYTEAFKVYGLSPDDPVILPGGDLVFYHALDAGGGKPTLQFRAVVPGCYEDFKESDLRGLATTIEPNLAGTTLGFREIDGKPSAQGTSTYKGSGTKEQGIEVIGGGRGGRRRRNIGGPKFIESLEKINDRF